MKRYVESSGGREEGERDIGLQLVTHLEDVLSYLQEASKEQIPRAPQAKSHPEQQNFGDGEVIQDSDMSGRSWHWPPKVGNGRGGFHRTAVNTTAGNGENSLPTRRDLHFYGE